MEPQSERQQKIDAINQILHPGSVVPPTGTDARLPGDTVMRWQFDELEARLAKLEAWAKGYANPLLFRVLDFGEKAEINKKTPYDPPKDRDRPDLKLREL